jgi:hypothetical protein
MTVRRLDKAIRQQGYGSGLCGVLGGWIDGLGFVGGKHTYW